MASASMRAWIDRLAWTCIYGGLFAVILGVVSGEVHVIAGWSLGVLGAIVAVAGVVLIVVRSRLRDDDGAHKQ
jgi:hypothetical protein